MTSVFFYSNDCDNAAAISSSRSSADTIDQHSTGDNKSNVDGGESDATATSTAEIAHFAEQLDSISDDEEGGEGSGETLNSITGGLQVGSTFFTIPMSKMNIYNS